MKKFNYMNPGKNMYKSFKHWTYLKKNLKNYLILTFPADFLKALVHFAFLGFFFFLKARWHFDLIKK